MAGSSAKVAIVRTGIAYWVLMGARNNATEGNLDGDFSSRTAYPDNWVQTQGQGSTLGHWDAEGLLLSEGSVLSVTLPSI